VDGTNGLLTEPRDHQGMADAIVRLLSDADARRRMGQAGLALVRSHFTVERMVAGVAHVYERLAGTRRGAGTASPSARG
jgi:glycosyltransferase involved in cell wall biosynthesis